MITDVELQAIEQEALAHPECIECRTILRLVAEVARLHAVEDEWIAGHPMPTPSK